MKKIAITFFCCLLVLTGCSSAKEKGGKVYDVTASEAVKKIENKESFVLIVSLDTCPHCEDLKEELKKNVADQGVSFYRVELKSEDTTTLYSDIDMLEKHLTNPSKIPHIYIIENGKEKKESEGYDGENPDEFWNFIEENV